MEQRQHTAQLAKKRRAKWSDRYTVQVTCSACGHVERLGCAGWSAIICRGCGCTLQRGTYEAQP